MHVFLALHKFWRAWWDSNPQTLRSLNAATFPFCPQAHVLVLAVRFELTMFLNNGLQDRSLRPLGQTSIFLLVGLFATLTIVCVSVSRAHRIIGYPRNGVITSLLNLESCGGYCTLRNVFCVMCSITYFLHSPPGHDSFWTQLCETEHIGCRCRNRTYLYSAYETDEYLPEL